MGIIWWKDSHMQNIAKSTQGLGLLLSLNWDRLLFLATILMALSAGAVLPLLFQ